MLNQLRDEVYSTNVDHGFWELPQDIPVHLQSFIEELIVDRKISLIHSELGEATESHRTAPWLDPEMELKRPEDFDNPDDFMTWFESNVKDSIEDELADSMIRELDLCGHKKVDIDYHVRTKMVYNEYRSHKHGKKF